MRETAGLATSGANRGGLATVRAMAAAQADMFALPALTPRPPDEVVAAVRARLRTTLALVKAADAMPWKDLLAVIREDNAFRHGTGLLPGDEGTALWAEFDVEMDRLYAVMNAAARQEPDA